MRSAAGARALFGALLVLVLLIAMVISGLTGSLGSDPQSARSKEPAGRLAAALLLEELGIEHRLFEAAPISLPQGPNLLWLPGAPRLPDHLLAGVDEARGPALDDPRHGLFYRRFVEEGGTLVVPATVAARPFLERALGLDDPPLAQHAAAPGGEVRLLGGAPLRLGSPARLGRGGAPLRAPLLPGEPEPLAVDAEGLVFALRIPFGAGALVLLADDAFLTHAELPLAEHALFFACLVELLRPSSRPLYFDEFALGGWRPVGKLELALSPGARGVTLHLLLLALLWAWMHAWPREFPRDPPPLELRSPLERARAQAGLLLRGAQVPFLAERLRAGVLRRLARALRLPAREVEGSQERAVALSALLERAPRARHGSLRALLAERAVTNGAELEALGRELLDLERALLADFAHGSPSRPTLPAARRSGDDAVPARPAQPQ